MLLNSLKIKLHHISKLMRSKATNKASQSLNILDKNKSRRHFNNFYRLQTTRLNCKRILYLANGLIVYIQIS